MEGSGFAARAHVKAAGPGTRQLAGALTTMAIPVLRPAVLLVACLTLVQGCVIPYADHPPVPLPLAEDVPAPPSAAVTLIWRPGHYDWTGMGYAWVRGAWVDRAGHGSLWQDGYWRRSGPNPVWVPAHWI